MYGTILISCCIRRLRHAAGRGRLSRQVCTEGAHTVATHLAIHKEKEVFVAINPEGKYYGYVPLTAAVMWRGLEGEGLGYALTPGGKFWCRLENLQPCVWREASRSDHGARRENELPGRAGKAV